MEDDATESVTAHAREAELSARRYIETVTAGAWPDGQESSQRRS